MHLTTVVLFSILISFTALGQNEKKKSLVKWYTFEEAVKLQEQQPKTLFIDMYTDWCGWCKVMDTTTFVHPQIANYINTHFYPVKFNAERKDTVIYKGKTYTNTGEGRRPPHQLAVELLRGKMSYPTIVYIDDNWNVNPLSGYMPPEKIESFLVYFAERINRSAPHEDFNKNYTELIRNKKKNPELIKWYTFPEALDLNSKNPKKVLVSIYSDFNHGSKVLNNACLNHPVIAKYINEHYYPVKIQAEMTDTVVVGEQVFINEQKIQNYPHQLPIALLQGQLFYPTLLFLDKDNKIMNRAPGYMTARDLETVLNFIGGDNFLNQEWEQYKQNFVSQIQ